MRRKKVSQCDLLHFDYGNRNKDAAKKVTKEEMEKHVEHGTKNNITEKKWLTMLYEMLLVERKHEGPM